MLKWWIKKITCRWTVQQTSGLCDVKQRRGINCHIGEAQNRECLSFLFTKTPKKLITYLNCSDFFSSNCDRRIVSARHQITLHLISCDFTWLPWGLLQSACTVTCRAELSSASVIQIGRCQVCEWTDKSMQCRLPHTFHNQTSGSFHPVKHDSAALRKTPYFHPSKNNITSLG